MAYNYSTGFINATLASIASELENGCIEVYTGTRPTSADAPIKGILLGTITSGGLAFSAGSAANGLKFQANTVDGSIDKVASQTWQFKALANGAAGWLRIKANAIDSGASTSISALRIDGSIAAYGGDATIEGSTTLVKDKIYTINSCTISWAK